MSKKRIVVTGAGGFVGHHLSKYLVSQGYWVRGVDLKRPQFSKTACHEFKILDLREKKNCLKATKDMEEVYALAADMGGMGFIDSNHATILYNNSLINLFTIEAARLNHCRRLFYTSSACIYPKYKQTSTQVTPLKEEDAYPADPQGAYGWEKLITERMCLHYREEYGLETRIVRFHNIYGPEGAWKGGREKAPAALCRKIALAKFSGKPEIEIWGDGEQTRSFCFIDDCVVGIHKLMRSEHRDPLNLGHDQLVSINQIVDIIASAAGIAVKKKYIEGPQGVRGRNSDNTRLREVLGWAPQISLEEGLRRTYHWVEERVRQEIPRDRRG
ncbi:MAG: NAD-dependent epimerase/dehydratase family protein [Candidatus Omnitrophica bacterium]|nr:NAD-dependent epimerase/dehydratase family protein [Candidatus Omnitrophota bacterium]